MAENKNAKTPADDGQPVAWANTLDFDDDDIEIIPAKNKGKLGTGNCDIPLYTAPQKQWVGLTDEEIDALSQARSLTDELMDCVDRLGSEADTVDPRVWQHLLVYAPKPEEEPVAWISESDNLLSWDKFYDHMKPLYTAPPKREWVGLTDDEADELVARFARYELLREVEAKLKEKNHG